MMPASRLSRCIRFLLSLALFSAAALAVITTTGCGAGSTPGPKLSGNTEVTVLLSSSANDQLQDFQFGFTNITLTSQSGKKVNLLTVPQGAQGAEFIHINGGAEPLVTASVPQDIYTAATAGATYTYPATMVYQFSCATQLPSEIFTNTFDAVGSGYNKATINFPGPITITGNSMVLSLDLLVSQSETFSSCYSPSGHYTWTFTPTFNLTPLTLSSQPTNPENGKVTGVHGEVASIDAASSTFTVSLPVEEGPETLSFGAGNATIYQGIGGFSALAVGTFVDLDAAIQSNGSLLATRIAVEDTSATNVLTGTLLSVAASNSNVTMFVREEEGASFPPEADGPWGFNFGSAVFQISGQLTNLHSLPFTPGFNGSNTVAGQNLYITAPAIGPPGEPHPYPVVRTVTLIPQTVNGTIAAISNSGSLAVYTVTLAPYDVFPTFAVQPGQKTLLTNPSQVEVYADSSTQMLNSEALAVGKTLRFNGLVFNDNGTLRMDCSQVNDGVTE